MVEKPSHLDCYGHLQLHTFTSGYLWITVMVSMDLEVCPVEQEGCPSQVVLREMD